MAQQPPENMRICSAGSEDRLATQQQQQRSTSRSRTCDETELSRERGANRPQDAHAVQGLPAPPVGGTAAVGSGEPALRITEAAERGQPPALRIVPPDTAFMVPSSKPLSVHADSAALATPRGALDLASSSANSTPAPSASNTPRHPLSAPPASASRTPSAGPQAAATSAALHRSATYTVACTGTSPSVRDLTEAKLHQLGSQVLQLVAGAGGAIRTASTILSNPYMGSNAVYPSWAEPASNILAEQGGHGITTIEFSPVLMVPTLQHLVVSGLHVNMSAARWAQAELPTPYVGDPAYNEKYPLMADVCKCQLLDESPYPHLLTGDNGKLLDKDAMLVAWLIKWLAYLAKQCARGVRIFRMWAFSPDPVTRQGLQRLADAVMQDLGLLLRLADQAKEGASTEELWRVNNLDAFCRSPSYSQDAAVACVKQLRAAKSEEGMPGAAAGGASSGGSGSGGGGGAGSQQAAAQPPTDDMVMYRVSKAAHGATSSAGGNSSMARSGYTLDGKLPNEVQSEALKGLDVKGAKRLALAMGWVKTEAGCVPIAGSNMGQDGGAAAAASRENAVGIKVPGFALGGLQGQVAAVNNMADDDPNKQQAQASLQEAARANQAKSGASKHNSDLPPGFSPKNGGYQLQITLNVDGRSKSCVLSGKEATTWFAVRKLGALSPKAGWVESKEGAWVWWREFQRTPHFQALCEAKVIVTV